ncbi:zinc finger protein 358-like isoform X2 [Bacillus rossius redtenbacheri]|uniref:zinc finger protein 358-like isoform X2 n=1 Tax=Bacillus rossius redtenbacheri TaxID=93214 RepID=UPI002FDE09FB
MVTSCCAINCTERHVKGGKVTFHKFPKDAARRAAWIEAVHRKNWTPTKNSMLCSDHFTEDCFDRTSLSVVRLREYAVPSVFPTFPDHLKKKVERLKNQHEKDFKLRYELENQKKRECLNSSELCYKMDTKNLEKSQIIKQEIFPPNVCRICANICDRLVPIFGDRAKEKGLVTKIHTHLPIMVTVQDALPVNICEDCLGKLNVCHNIVNTCLNADTTLKCMFGLPSEQAEEVFPESDTIRQPVPALSETAVTRPVLVPSSASVGSTPVIPNGSLQAESSTTVTGRAPVKQASAKRAEPTSGEVYSHETSDAQVVGGKACPQRREGDRLFPGTRRGVQLERQYVCPTCGKAFRDGSALHHHQDIHRDIKYTCKECGKVYGNRSGLYWHAWTHRNATFLCPVCGELVRKGSSVYTHKMKHARACHWCGEKFSDWEMLKAHKRLRHKNCPNKCTCCAKQSANTDRKSDVLSSPCKDWWECEFCGCAFARQSALSIHMTRKHRCHHCMQCFKDKYELSAHERTHMREGNAEDEDDKPHSVASAQDSYTVFTCDGCGEVFFHVHRYCRHRAECKSLQNWECHICGKVLSDSFGVMVHKQVHSSRKPYRCHFCNKRFGFVNLLKKHSIISHPVLW